MSERVSSGGGRRTPAAGERRFELLERISFTVPGPPQGKARARTVRNKYTGKPMSYTPESTVLYENWIRTCYMQVDGGIFERNEALMIGVHAYFEPPKSVSKTKRADMLSGKLRPLKKPDGDNILKVVCDALNGLAYRDDIQLAEKHIYKEYAEKARLEIVLMKI